MGGVEGVSEGEDGRVRVVVGEGEGEQVGTLEKEGKRCLPPVARSEVSHTSHCGTTIVTTNRRYRVGMGFKTHRRRGAGSCLRL